MEGWEIMKIKGIPLRVHSSCFFILILFSWTVKVQLTNFSGIELPVFESWIIGFITALLLFLSVLLHELGHSFMALHEGLKVRSITLFFLGGVAKVERECPTAMGSFRVALAGPVVSFCVAFILLTVRELFIQNSVIISNVLGQLGSLNLVLALFNLLPGLPLDGGIILKSLVWHFTGSRNKGIKIATLSGRLLSILAIFLGSWICLNDGSLEGLWLIVLGWFGLAASRSQSQMLRFQKILTEVKVSQVFGRRYRVLEDDLPLKRLSEFPIDSEKDYLCPEWILLCNSGRWVGYIDNEPLKKLPVQDWNNYSLGDYSKPLSDLPSLSEKVNLLQAVLALEKTKEGRILVLSLAGLPIGTLDRIDIGIVVLRHLGLKPPSKFIELARKQNVYPLGLALPKVVESILSSGLVDNDYSSSLKR